MSDNKFSENMVVCAVGNLSPGNISDSCESCPHNKFSFPGVLIAGVTKDAVMLLSEKVDVVPEGTTAKVVELEELLQRSMQNNDELRNDNYQLRALVEDLERQVQDYKEENVKLLQTLLALHRAVKRANVELDKIEESCDNNVWFSQLKERTY